ncbi:MAG: SixA phosphatase family protein [Flavobacteriales bacterium]
MPKTLILIRHAKSSWAIEGQPDFERPLNDRGMKAAPFMAKRWAKIFSPKVHLISSTAKRAHTTAQFFVIALHEEWGKPVVLKNEKAIYHAPLSDLLGIVNGLENKHSEVVLFGHNPGMSELLYYLTGEMISMPTCAVAKIELNIDDWAMVSEGIGTLAEYDYPKKHVIED